MKFQRLRLLGFKSFCEATDFLIEPGLTGVVGPNGCGKSNLVEALRWVMGENSYKNMRASGMDDVIFSGGGSRPARNLAEVGLVLDNSSRTAPAVGNVSTPPKARYKPRSSASERHSTEPACFSDTTRPSRQAAKPTISWSSGRLGALSARRWTARRCSSRRRSRCGFNGRSARTSP